MESLQARIDSFSKSRRVKNPSKPSSSVTVKWPHPPTFRASPEALAEAGFYFNPSFEDRDNVTCFACEKQLGNWEKDDDPFNIHWEKRGLTCCWASVRCGLREDMDRTGRFTFPDKTRLPTSKVMEKARLDTFSTGDGWIHDQVKNHGASSKKLARAGFTYTPQYPGDDLATCLYCNVSLSGWDAEDDPMYDFLDLLQCPQSNLSSP
ncbi:inhibitor of apoptosis repeat-containing protein [Crucibulum laeve]|uniref:Inhibitor of apoptosis repeat-containing protein n=1 Tax=Crucibulum laeve TaxID=68775 RepID=A0A5C3M5T4_9AGAR|nr:inhibitor of apoptosis repeat-containing protein [Crucibulum laeve]